VILISLFRGIYLLVNNNSPVVLENKLSRKRINTALVQKGEIVKTQEGFKVYKYYIDNIEKKCLFAMNVLLKPMSFGQNLEIFQNKNDKNCKNYQELLASYQEMVLAKIFKEWSKVDVRSLTLFSITLLDSTLTDKYLNAKVVDKENLSEYISSNKLDQNLKKLFIGFGLIIKEPSLEFKELKSNEYGVKSLKYSSYLIRQEDIM
jgi:hypothetical protein